ncbi:MAG TPA: hypothetical protein VKV04_05325 [Verrucomicrobiae bacterium]|nr:hypothetical protein [Verrucomicrobiae bacterium]
MKLKITILIAAMWLACATNALAFLQSPLAVSNIVELQSLNVGQVEQLEGTNSISPIVLVLGYYYPGDRGGGTFQWDPDSAGVPDGGRFFPTNGWTSGNGRWVRRLSGEVANVRMWGAMGNVAGGVEIPANMAAAHDDTTNIQNAFNSMFVAGDGQSWMPSEMLFPAGWYKISNTLIFSQQLKIYGENARMSHIVMPYGVNKDILHSIQADEALNGTNGSGFFDENVRIEDISLEFATQTGIGSVEQGHNMTNAGIVVIRPEEGSTIRNVSVNDAGIGIRVLGGGGGAVAPFRDTVFGDCAIAGISVEPVPGISACLGQVSITGITSDHRWDESRSNACLVRFVSYEGTALVEDINVEGIYGGGIIQSQGPGASDEMGVITIRNASYDGGASYSGFDGPHDFLVIKDTGGSHSDSIIMDNVSTFGMNMIRDELGGRTIIGLDADGQGNNQSVCRLPLQYESWNGHSSYADGVPAVFTRLISGGETIYNFNAPTNGWYRILRPLQGWKVGGRITVASMYDSSEFQVDLLSDFGATSAAQINVTRATRDDGVDFRPAVTQVRAGTYWGPDGYSYGFVDLYVANPLNFSWEPDIANLITVTYPVFNVNNLTGSSGMSPLLNPTAPLTSITPPGCTLIQCVTNNLTR